jgi:hypothetical protein
MKFAFLSRHRVADGLWRRGRNGHLSHTCEGVGVGVGVGEGEGEDVVVRMRVRVRVRAGLRG